MPYPPDERRLMAAKKEAYDAAATAISILVQGQTHDNLVNIYLVQIQAALVGAVDALEETLRPTPEYRPPVVASQQLKPVNLFDAEHKEKR